MNIGNMRQVAERPTEGQFVQVWIYGGQVWADTYRYIEGKLHVYQEGLGDWAVEPGKLSEDCHNFIYLVI